MSERDIEQAGASEQSSDLNGPLLDSAVANLSPEQRNALLLKAAEESLRLEAEQVRMNRDYIDSRKRIEDHIDAFEQLDKSGHLTRHRITTEIKGANSSIRIESRAGGTCFVATAAYRDASHPDVVYLRWLRDHHLRQHPLGRRFIAWYWRIGPKLAVPVGSIDSLRLLARTGLGWLVSALRRRWPAD